MIQLFLALILPALAQNSPLAGFAGLTPVPASVSYEGRYTAARTPAPDLTDNKVTVALPSYRDEVHAVAPSLTAGRVHVGRPVNLNTGQSVPRELSRIEVGAQYTHQLSRGRNWGVRASVGYAGDRPFAANEDLSYGVGGTYGFPGAKGYWVVMLLLSNNGVLPNFLPIPGVLYVYRTPRFTGIFGLPVLALNWTPGTAWALSLSAFGPLVRTEAAYGDKAKAQVFAGYALTQQMFIPDRRERDQDRLKIQEQRAGAGLRTTVAKGLTAEAQGGYAFARSVAISRGFSKRAGSAALPDDWYASLQASYTF